MLVEMMNRMLSITRMNDAQYALMNQNMRMNSMLSNQTSFAGDSQSLERLHQFETQFAIDKEINELRYMLAQRQCESSKQALNNSLKDNKFSIIA